MRAQRLTLLTSPEPLRLSCEPPQSAVNANIDVGIAARERDDQIGYVRRRAGRLPRPHRIEGALFAATARLYGGVLCIEVAA